LDKLFQFFAFFHQSFQVQFVCEETYNIEAGSLDKMA